MDQFNKKEHKTIKLYFYLFESTKVPLLLKIPPCFRKAGVIFAPIFQILEQTLHNENNIFLSASYNIVKGTAKVNQPV